MYAIRLRTLDYAIHTTKEGCLDGIKTKLGDDKLTLISELGKMGLLGA